MSVWVRRVAALSEHLACRCEQDRWIRARGSAVMVNQNQHVRLCTLNVVLPRLGSDSEHGHVNQLDTRRL